MTPLRCMYIYLTDACNLRCVHCWQAAPLVGTAKTSRLRFADCEAFLGTAAGLGLASVTLSGGEPLLNPDFPRFAEYFHAHGITCAVETNGMLIDDRRIGPIARHRVYCAISVDGASAEVHGRTRGLPDAFDRTCGGIARLEAHGCRYQILMALSRLNLDDLRPLADRIAAEWPHCDLLKLNIVWPEGRGAGLEADGALLGPEAILDLIRDVGTIVDRYPFRIYIHVSPAFFTPQQLRKKYGCGGQCGYHHALSVLSDGTVSICSLGKYEKSLVLGHVTGIDLADVWATHPTLRDIHESTHTRLKGVCSRCVFRRACLGGCRAAALHHYGDFFAPYPPCQTLFEHGLFPRQWLAPGRAASGQDGPGAWVPAAR